MTLITHLDNKKKVDFLTATEEKSPTAPGITPQPESTGF